ncbi:choice-of-anchor D domain-containing protein [bacterium]|nr:choice-of-anchor D domain-containing protein [bacterium]
MNKYILYLIIGSYLCPCICTPQMNESDILPEIRRSGDQFGWSISTFDKFLIVGARQDEDIADNAGAAYIFKKEDDTWRQQSKLKAIDGTNADLFGSSVSISDSHSVIGAPGNLYAQGKKGSVYVFKYSNNAWLQTQKLEAYDGVDGDEFGVSVDMSGVYIVVGSHGDDDKGENSGSVYIYKFDSENWNFVQKITASDGRKNDGFGNDVAIHGNHIIVGVNNYDSPRSTPVYIYRLMADGWIEQTRIKPADAVVNDCFGCSVDIDDNHACIGAFRQNTGIGAVYIYRLNDTNWVACPKLTPPDPVFHQFFGESVSLSENLLIIGSPNNEESVYIYHKNNLDWSLLTKLNASDRLGRDYFGIAVSINDNAALIGAPYYNHHRGKVYVYDGITETGILDVALSRVLFDSVYTGEKISKQIILNNRGTGELVIEKLSIEGSYQFSIYDSSFSILPGDSAYINVFFNPNSSGRFEGTLSIASNANNIKIQIIGDATEPYAILSNTIHFGIGTKTKYINLTNTGFSSCHFGPFSVLGKDSLNFTCSMQSIELLPDKTVNIPVVFTPGNHVGYEAFLTIATEFGTETIELTGIGFHEAPENAVKSLSAGNVYFYRSADAFTGDYSDYQIEITGMRPFNEYVYYIFGENQYYERSDSTKIYKKYYSTDNEVVCDFTWQVGDTATNGGIVTKIDTTTIFGLSKKRVIINKEGIPSSESWTYHELFGLTSSNSSHLLAGGGSVSLRGAIIDGITYGDTQSNIPNNQFNLGSSDFYLFQNYPNPFNPRTKIKYNIDVSSNVTLKIYNISGQELVTLVNEFQIAGKYEIIWQPKGFPSGIYLYRLQVGKFSEVKKFILQK